MKKIFLFLCFGLLMASCLNEKKEETTSKASQSKVLVLYYSQTGATASVADQIKASLGADTEEIICEQPYSGTFEATIERCKKEHSAGTLPAIKPIKKNPRDYDIIFIGYPIWFGTYASPISTLLEKINFDGKMIVPFCTFGSGGLESSIEDLKKDLPKSVIMEGFGIRNARLQYLREELEDFLIRNGYMQGEVEEIPDFSVKDELTEEDKEVFHKACDDYQYPMGTPTSVAKRYTSKGTEYRFVTRGANNDKMTNSTIYVELRNEEGAIPEFTKVVR